MKGYFSADGCYSQGLYKATSVSRQLTYGIQACIHKVYHRPCALYKSKRHKTSVIEGRTINQKDTYSIAFKKENGKQDKAFYEDGYIWIPFKRKDVIEFNDNVYNFEVEEDNSYTAFNLIVHNCQDISVAGKQAGIIEGETRSGLYHDGLRILRYKKPKYSIIENVKNLTSEKFRPIFHQILCDLEDAGYHSYYEVLNAKDYGIPQNRERIFIVSIRKDIDQGFMFPLPFDNGLRLKDLLEDEVDEKYFISQEKTEKLLESLKDKDISNTVRSSGRSSIDKHQWDMVCVSVSRKGEKFEKEINVAHTLLARDYKGFDNTPSNAVCVPVLTSGREEKRQNGRRFKDDGEPMFSLTTQDRHGILQIGNIDQDIRTRENPQTGRVYDPVGIAPCLSTMQGGNLEPKILTCSPVPELVGGVGEINFGKQYRQGNRIYSTEKTAMALMSGPVGNAGGNSYLYYHNYRIRKLTPLECFRLMGFDDRDYWRCKDAGISDSQLYKMAGNSIVVQVLEGILNNLLKSGANVPDYFYGEQMNLFG